MDERLTRREYAVMWQDRSSRAEDLDGPYGSGNAARAHARDELAVMVGNGVEDLPEFVVVRRQGGGPWLDYQGRDLLFAYTERWESHLIAHPQTQER